MPHEGHKRLIGEQVGVAVAVRLNVAELGEQDVEFLLREVREADDGPAQVPVALGRERVLGEAALECLVAVQPAPRVHEELGRPTHEEAEVLNAALEAVVHDAENLLVIRLARLGA